MKPKILHVVDDFRPCDYGEQVALMAGTWTQSFRVSVCSISSRGRLPDVEHCALSFHARNRPAAIWQLRRWIGDQQADLVHSWGAAATALTRWALAGPGGRPGLIGRRAIPWVARYHATDDPLAHPIWSPRWKWLRQPAVKLLDERDGDVRVEFEERLTRFAIAPVDHAATDMDSPPTLREQLGVDASVKLVGVACPLEAQLGLKHLIWSIDLMHWARDVRLVVWGEGSQFGNLQNYARLIGSPGHYLWLSPDAPLHRPMGELDLWWEPRRDRVSPALLAALARGIPAVAFESKVHRGLVAGGARLRCVPWGARDELARESLRALNEPPQPPSSLPALVAEADALAADYAEFYRTLL